MGNLRFPLLAPAQGGLSPLPKRLTPYFVASAFCGLIFVSLKFGMTALRNAQQAAQLQNHFTVGLPRSFQSLATTATKLQDCFSHCGRSQEQGLFKVFSIDSTYHLQLTT